MLRIHRKSHHRKGYKRKGRRVKSAHVKKTTYLARDRGKRGRGKPFLKPGAIRKNILGEGFFDKSTSAQKRRLASQVRKRGEKSVQGQLQFIANVQKRTNPKVSRRARQLRKWVAKSF